MALLPGPKPCEAAEGAPAVAAVNFDYPAELPEGVRELVPIRPGEPLSGRKVRESLKLLWLKDLFQDIVVEAKETPSGIVLVYHLVPKLRVDDIKVEENDEVSKKKIIGRMSLKERDFIDEALIEKSKNDIKSLYEEEGYRKASVEIFVRHKEDPLKADIVAVINEGPPTKIDKIVFSGDTGLPEQELRKKIKIKEGQVAKREKINNAAEALTGYLVKENFVDAEVETDETFLDGEANIEFKIEAGPRLAVEFEGNESVSSRKLKKQLTFWEDRDISEEAISENLDKLIAYYKKEGYFFATADSRTEETKEPPVVAVRFLIDEGPRVRLEEVRTEGNRNLKASDIEDVMDLRGSGVFRKTRVTTEAVEQDMERIKAFYETKGFLRAEVKARELEFSPDREEAALVIDINEGPRSYVSSIDFKGNEQVGRERLLQTVSEKPGEPFNPQQVREDENSVISLYSQKGFIHAAVDSETRFSEDGTKADLVFNISEGTEVKAGRIILRGNEDTKDKVVLRELLVKTGAPLDYEKVLKSQQRIYRLGFFSQVRIQPVEPEKPEPVKDLLVTVKERDAGAVEVGAGYGDYEQFRGFAEVSYKNLFGLGHRISARGEMSTKGGKGLITYRWPWFLGKALDFRTSLVYLDLQKPSYQITDLIANTGFDKTFGEHITTSLAYQFENVKLDAAEDVALAPEDARKDSFAIASISPSVMFDYRDSPFNPTKGSVYAAVIKLASKYIGSTVDMFKLTAQASWYVPVYKRIIFGFSARGGIIEGWPSGTFQAPISERFFLGGASTLRGYEFETVGPMNIANDKPAGGESMVLFNSEVRFPLPYGFGLVTFLDAGNVWLSNRNFDEREEKAKGTRGAKDIDRSESRFKGLRYGAGIGLRYDTPVGPLRLDYGIKLNPLKGEPIGVLHFTVGQAF